MSSPFSLPDQNIFIARTTLLQFDTGCAILAVMDLRTYLSTLGDQTAAKLLGISERAARSYRTGMRLPRPRMAVQIVRRSNGKITLTDIYGASK